MERNKHIQGAYYAEKAMTAFLFAVTCSIALYAFIYMPGYNGFEISDWMINYQGGFVRRGLVGELLFMLEKVKPYNLRYAVIGIDMVFYILFFFTIFRIFRKYRLSLIGAMFPVACVTTSMAVYHRDFMMLCICCLAFHCFFKYLKEKRKLLLVVSVALVSLGIIVYEPVFFVIVPILMLQYWKACSENKTLKTALVFIIPTACMVLSCICSGTNEQVQAIWQSWLPYITADGYNPADGIGHGVGFLGLDTSYVIDFHLGFNLGDNILLNIITLVIVFALAFYLCTHIPQIDRNSKTIACNEYKNELARILVFQLLVQLPMFTVLSTDYGRTIPMSLYTTLFLFHFARRDSVNIYVTRPVEKLSKDIMSLFSRLPITNNTWFYILIVLIFPFQIFVPSLLGDNIMVHLFEKVSKYIF